MIGIWIHTVLEQAWARVKGRCPGLALWRMIVLVLNQFLMLIPLLIETMAFSCQLPISVAFHPRLISFLLSLCTSWRVLPYSDIDDVCPPVSCVCSTRTLEQPVCFSAMETSLSKPTGVVVVGDRPARRLYNVENDRPRCLLSLWAGPDVWVHFGQRLQRRTGAIS